MMTNTVVNLVHRRQTIYYRSLAAMTDLTEIHNITDGRLAKGRHAPNLVLDQ